MNSLNFNLKPKFIIIRIICYMIWEKEEEEEEEEEMTR